MHLEICKEVDLPLEAITQTFGVIAQKGAGKTYLTAVLCEEFADKGLPFIAVDPMGVYWGLRASADGLKEGIAVIIMGGDHGDVPLEATSGRVIADWVVAERRSAVLDLSNFSKTEQRRFVTDFAEQLYHKNREPLHLVLDEADMWAPQKPKGVERMLGSIEDLVRRGRARGIGLSLVTQRPAVLNKDVLTQVSVLVALRIVGPQDLAAVEAWIKYHGNEVAKRTVLMSLGSLPIGEAWLWSPGWLDTLERIKVRRRRTFDSSATPKLGETIITPQKLAPVDLDVLRERIASTIERAKETDPKELIKRVRELETQLSQKSIVDPESIKDAVRLATHNLKLRFNQDVDALRQELRKYGSQLYGETKLLQEMAARLEGKAGRLAAMAEMEFTTLTDDTNQMRRDPVVTYEGQPVRPARERLAPKQVGDLHVSSSMRAILNAMVWFASVGIDEPSRSNVAAIAGVSPRSSGYEKNVASLRNHHQAISFPIARPALAEQLGVSNTSSGFEKNVSTLSGLSLVTYPDKGLVLANRELLFPERLAS